MDATITKSRPRTGAQIHVPGPNYNHNNILCARSTARLTDISLGEGLMPCFPAADIRGWDVVMEYRGRFRRAQLRARAAKIGKEIPKDPPKSFTFSILRVRDKKKVNEPAYQTYRRHFHQHEIDVFIFMNLDYNLIWIVPVDAIDLTRTKFTVHLGDQWQNAWNLLK